MPELTNLLPIERARSVRSDYFFRLGTTLALAASALVVMHGALLAPSYIYVSEEARMRKAELAELSALAQASGAEAASARIEALSASARSLSELAGAPKATDAVRAVLGVPHDGIRITGMAVTAAEGEDPRMSISGVASTRDSLRRYRDRIAALPSVTHADLPLSVYAAESDLVFTIQMTGVPTP